MLENIQPSFMLFALWPEGENDVKEGLLNLYFSVLQIEELSSYCHDNTDLTLLGGVID